MCFLGGSYHTPHYKAAYSIVSVADAIEGGCAFFGNLCSGLRYFRMGNQNHC